MKHYQELNVWRQGIELVKISFALAKKLPIDEKFGVISQLTRAAVSIPANIAEGSGRNSDKDYARFVQIALGSAFELQTYFVITKEMKWLQGKDIEFASQLLEQEIKMIHAFLKKLKAND
jgi:four helix bundle protein